MTVKRGADRGRALGLGTLTANGLDAGVPVAPFDLSLPVPQTYPPEHMTRSALRASRSWLLGYAQRRC